MTRLDDIKEAVASHPEFYIVDSGLKDGPGETFIAYRSGVVIGENENDASFSMSGLDLVTMQDEVDVGHVRDELLNIILPLRIREPMVTSWNLILVED